MERRRLVEEAASSDLLKTLQEEQEALRKAEEERIRQEKEDAKLAGEFTHKRLVARNKSRLLHALEEFIHRSSRDRKCSFPFLAQLSSQKSPSKFPVPKVTRSKNKAAPPVPKDQPILTAAVLTTPKSEQK